MQIEEAKKYCKQIKDRDLWKVGYVYGSEAIETVLNCIETMQKEFDRLEGIEDNTSMLLKELVETKEHNRQLGLEIARLNNRCKKLDREAQSYLEEMVGDEGLKERTIKGLEFEIEQKDKIIDLLADDLRYYEGMQQDQLFCIDTCEGKMCDEEHCKERIKEYFYKKVE